MLFAFDPREDPEDRLTLPTFLLAPDTKRFRAPVFLPDDLEELTFGADVDDLDGRFTLTPELLRVGAFVDDLDGRFTLTPELLRVGALVDERRALGRSDPRDARSLVAAGFRRMIDRSVEADFLDPPERDLRGVVALGVDFVGRRVAPVAFGREPVGFVGVARFVPVLFFGRTESGRSRVCRGCDIFL